MVGDFLRMIVAVLALTAPAPTAPTTRDDTASLQAQLDGAQDVTLPALPDESCYRTRGLWVNRNDTVISSPDGACIEAIGPATRGSAPRTAIPSPPARSSRSLEAPRTAPIPST